MKINTGNLKRLSKKIFNKRNVVGFGFGNKFVNGTQTLDECIQVYVTKKIPLSFLNKKDRIPKKIKGTQTDVIEVGEIKALISPNNESRDLQFRKEKHRPAMPGISVGHPFVTAGTIGAVVEKNGKCFILGNNHVLSNSNNAKIGDITIQPGTYDGGNPLTDVIGYLADFEPIKFGNNNGNKTWMCAILDALSQYFNCSECKTRGEDSLNIMDAAISLVNKNDVDAEIYEIGKVTGVAETSINEVLKKSGRTTGVLSSMVISTNATVTVNYGEGKTAMFENQIMTGCMSKGGDSGSLVLNSQNEAVALLFAGSDTVTIVNPIKPILQRFGVSFNQK